MALYQQLTMSVCKSEFSSCYNLFKIKTNDKFEEVSCEEFFQAIEDKNKSCNGCLAKIGAGCC